MMIRWLVGLAVAASMFAAPAVAQNNQDMIVVTASKRQAVDEEAADVDGVVAGARRELPYVSIIVPADFVIFTVTLETGTRSVDEAQRELERTFTTLTTKVARAQGVILEVGEPGNSSTLETTEAREAVELGYGDRSRIPLVFKFAVQKGDTFRTVRTRAEKFINEIQLTGRAEAVTGDLQYIGVTDPKKHREDLLKKIAEDARLLQTTFSGASTGATAISLTGLEGRVRTRPNGPLDMEIYIPYSIVLGSPQR
ncbi:MAG: hypothetical protein Q8R02_20560 [Hyphomonadaceae bacterium]|nr:hypothetical protein [Hyphomonadaceae bacterium]